MDDSILVNATSDLISKVTESFKCMGWDSNADVGDKVRGVPTLQMSKIERDSFFQKIEEKFNTKQTTKEKAAQVNARFLMF